MPNPTECVKQAVTILRAEKVGQLASDSDSVRAWREKSTAVAGCIQFGDMPIIAVTVSRDDPVAGNTVFNALRAGSMKKYVTGTVASRLGVGMDSCPPFYGQEEEPDAGCSPSL